jgi:hypothetical protein
MNSIFSRTLKALCTIVVAGVLTACGSGSTVDPFKPTRVIGLGDGFNDSARAIAPTVADQVATNFSLGLSSVVNGGSTTATIAALSAQIDSVIGSGGFTSGDLVVISVGTIDVQNSASPTANNEVPELVRQVQRLLDYNVKHVLVMPVLDVSRTPWGVTNSFEQGSAAATNSTGTFNNEVLTRLSATFGGRSPNPVIYANSGSSPISSQFLSMTATTPIWISPFNCFKRASCTNGATADTSLFDTSDTYLTSVGNKWVGNLLYNATAQGWR